MSVAIDKAGQDCHAAEVNHLCVWRDRQRSAYSFDLAVADENVLVALDRAAIWINQAACFYEHDLRRGTCQRHTQAYDVQCNSICHSFNRRAALDLYTGQK